MKARRMSAEGTVDGSITRGRPTSSRIWILQLRVPHKGGGDGGKPAASTSDCDIDDDKDKEKILASKSSISTDNRQTNLKDKTRKCIRNERRCH